MLYLKVRTQIFKEKAISDQGKRSGWADVTSEIYSLIQRWWWPTFVVFYTLIIDI